MKFGFVFPRANIFEAIEFAKSAEKSGWDGFFFWEPTYGIDAWMTLGIIARETRNIRIGTLLSPLSRMRPWKIASEVLTLDILSKGRAILCVGLGAIDTGFEELGEETDRNVRGELLDEGLDIIQGLWNWDLSNYEGKHYKIRNLKNSDFFKRYSPPSLIQSPRVPIWVVGAWKYQKSMQRAMKYDGILPIIKTKKGGFEELQPYHISEIKAYINDNRISNGNFDIIIEGRTPVDVENNAESIIMPFKEAGATWWIESDWTTTDLNKILQRVEMGPPL